MTFTVIWLISNIKLDKKKCHVNRSFDCPCKYKIRKVLFREILISNICITIFLTSLRLQIKNRVEGTPFNNFVKGTNGFVGTWPWGGFEEGHAQQAQYCKIINTSEIVRNLNEVWATCALIDLTEQHSLAEQYRVVCAC